MHLFVINISRVGLVRRYQLLCRERTRKLSCRKGDRAMRPSGCPEKFLESLSTATATFPEISNGLFFRSIVWMCVQNLKCLALPVP